MSRMRVFLGMPYYPGAVDAGALLAAVVADNDEFSVEFSALASTGTAKGFNALWSAALGRAEHGEVTHFAMLHADIAPHPHWLVRLVAECSKYDAHMIAAVVPIKDDRGLTSTGCDKSPGDPWHVRRFSLAEIARLPETFSTQDTIDAGINPAGTPLLVNTGCWVADLRKPLWYDADERGALKFYFTMNDEIRRRPDGSFEVLTESEDWFFSRRLAEAGGSYYATRTVRLRHIGRWAYGNDSVWGRWKTDEAQA